MTLGTGIFASTLLVVLVWIAFQISKHNRWGRIGKIIGVLMLVALILGIGGWGVNLYLERPQPVTELAGVRFGMTPTELMVTKGEPTSKGEVEESKTEGYWQSWFYPNGSVDQGLQVVLGGDSEDDFLVDAVCNLRGHGRVQNIEIGDTEASVVGRFGEPSQELFSDSKLTKTMEYDHWNVVFSIEKGEVRAFCATNSTGLKYDGE